MNSVEGEDGINEWFEQTLAVDNFDVSPFFKYLLPYKLEEFKQTSDIFHQNLEAADGLLDLSLAIANFSAIKAAQEKVKVSISEGIDLLPKVVPELTEVIRIIKQSSDVEKGLEEMPKSENLQQFLGHCGQLLVVMMQLDGKSGNEVMKEALRPMLELRGNTRLAIEHSLRASVCSVWTSFEVLAVDLWEECVNKDPENFARKASKEKQGVSERQISVDDLRRYKYDLSSRMGTLLKDKFHFSSVSGIEKAYVCLFGKERVQKIWTPEMRSALLNLEKCRHLIQHRAGVIDLQFLNATKRTDTVGEMLKLTKREYRIFRHHTTLAGLSLLAMASGHFTKRANLAVSLTAEPNEAEGIDSLT